MSLTRFDISPSFGFLSLNTPAIQFEDPIYQPWDDLIGRLSTLIASNTLETHILSLPVLPTNKFKNESEWRRAYVVLSYLVHGYLWSEDPPRATMPPQLSDPFLTVCEHLGLEPILSYAGICLWNWCLKIDDGVTPVDPATALKNLKHLNTIGSFTGTQDEVAFNVVPDMVEAAGGHLPSLLFQVIQSFQDNDNVKSGPKINSETVNLATTALVESSKTIVAMGEALANLNQDTCNPDFFYHKIRPWIAGSAGLDNGITFELSDGTVRSEVRNAGGSAIQSSLFPALDLLLGVKHRDSLMRDMRAYMPGVHRQFLNEVEQMRSIGEFVAAVQRNGKNSSVDNHETAKLVEAFETLLEVMRIWRSKHISIVTRYIVLPARKAEKEKNKPTSNGSVNGNIQLDVSTQNEDANDSKALNEIKGTGGSALIPFLKEVRDETRMITNSN